MSVKTGKNAAKRGKTREITPEPVFTPDQIRASLCRDSFFDFMRQFWHTVVPERPVWNWHIEFLCHELQEVAERVFLGLPKLHDVTVNISPGSTKSTIASIMYPAWVWCRMPSARIVTASYSYDIAVDNSRKSRDVIRSELYARLFPEIRIRDDQDAKNHYVNTAGGERYAFGVGGAVMGKHGHFLIVDDPLNPTQAASDKELSAANMWMEETLPSRKVDKAVTPTILIMQRLHENDPTGVRLEKADRIPHRHICLPAELTDSVSPPEARACYADGLMDPVRLPYSVLSAIEAEQGDYVLAAQYLQTPIPRGTAMFMTAKMQVREPPGRYVRLARFWDKAGTENGGAFSVGTKMAIDHDGHFWVLDVVRGQWDTGRREQIIKETAQRDGKHVVVGVEEEPGSGGKHSAQWTVRALAGFIVRAFKVGRSDGDKANRAYAFSSQVNVGNVSLAPGGWNRDFVKELKFFPLSKYKDQVDSSAGAFNMVAAKRIRLGGKGVLPSKRVASPLVG